MRFAILLTLCLSYASSVFARPNPYYFREYAQQHYTEIYGLDDAHEFKDSEDARRFLDDTFVQLNAHTLFIDIAYVAFGGCGFLAFALFSRCVPAELRAGFSGGSGLAAAIALGYSLLDQLPRTFRSSSRSISFFINYQFINPEALPQDHLRGIEVKFLLNKQTLPARVSHLIAAKLFDLRLTEEERDVAESEINMIDILLSFPRLPKQVVMDQTVIDDIRYKFADISDPLLRSMRQYQLEVRKPSSLFLAKKSLFFLGLPGVGKSTVAKQMAAAMGLNWCLIKLEGKRIYNLLGETNSNPNSIYSETQLGEIGSCFAKANHTNPVLIFDDIDRRFSSDFLSFFLTIIDPDVASLEHPILGKLDLSNIFVIFTGNFQLATERTAKSGEMDALMQRFSHIVDFKGHSYGYKEKYLKDTLLPQLIETYEADVQKNYDSLVQEALITANDPGMRVAIQNLRELFAAEVLKQEEG